MANDTQKQVEKNREKKIDEAGEESFPASDAPAWTAKSSMQIQPEHTPYKITLAWDRITSSFDYEIYNRLKNDLWYVIKRQESVADLNQIIEAVIMDNNKNMLPSSVEQEKNRNRRQRAAYRERRGFNGEGGA